MTEKETYWEEAMQRRMNTREEVHRLIMTLKGYLYEQNEYAKRIENQLAIHTPIEFWETKRPYGNKDIPASIAFHLGWDNERKLTKERLPEFIEEKAMEIHQLVLVNLVREARIHGRNEGS